MHMHMRASVQIRFAFFLSRTCYGRVACPYLHACVRYHVYVPRGIFITVMMMMMRISTLCTGIR